MSTESYAIAPIGYVRSCFKEKFGVPRQAGLVHCANAEIVLDQKYCDQHAVDGLAQFSHIWVIFCFHLSMKQGWKSRVRPPRLGGNRSLGVFATRSPFRPNPIGLSAVKLNQINNINGEIHLLCSSGDFVDGSPVLDIKPYIPYADRIPGAKAGYAEDPPKEVVDVRFTHSADKTLATLSGQYPELRMLIRQVLKLDPRPKYKPEKDTKLYSVALYDFDIKWWFNNSQIWVEEIVSRDQTQLHQENSSQTE